MYTASTGQRIIAHLFDKSMNFIFWIPITIKLALHWIQGGQDFVVPWFWIFGTMGSQMVFQMLCLYWIDGTLGQWFMGLKTVSTFHPELGLSFFQCFIQSLAERLEIFLGNSLYFSGFAHRERRHLVNLLAETRVVQSLNQRKALVKTRTLLTIILCFFSMFATLVANVDYYQRIDFSPTAIKFNFRGP